MPSKTKAATSIPSTSLLVHCHGGGWVSQTPRSRKHVINCFERFQNRNLQMECIYGNGLQSWMCRSSQ